MIKLLLAADIIVVAATGCYYITVTAQISFGNRETDHGFFDDVYDANAWNGK